MSKFILNFDHVRITMLTVVELFYDFVISTLMGLFGLHLITKKGFLAAKFLGVFFLVFCFRTIMAYFMTDGRLIQYPQFIYAFSPFHFLAPAISFLFVYFMLYPKRKMVLWQGLLFVPFLVHLAELIPFFVGPLENKIKEVELIMKYQSLINYPSEVCHFSPQTLAILKVFYTLLGAVSSFVMVLYFTRINRYKRSFVMNWLFAFTTLSLLSIVFIIAYVLGIIGFNNLSFSYADLLMHLAAFVNLGVVLYCPSLLDQYTFKTLVEGQDQQQRQPELDEDVAKLKKYETYAERLEEFFIQEKPFLNPNLTLEKTAKKLDISTKELSRVTAYIYKQGYPDFVNSWRINYIVEQRKSDKQWQVYSQDMLAELSGFGSRQSFHNAVNRLHSTTPSTFFVELAYES